MSSGSAELLQRDEEPIVQDVVCAADQCADRWMAAMLAGHFEAAWRESDALRKRGVPDPHRFWNGEDIQGARVMVRSLHGYGDAVQMLRYALRLRATASKVMFEVAPRFLELASMFRGVDEVVTWGGGVPANPPAWDVQVEVMELPYLFRTAVTDLPLATEYLDLPNVRVRKTAQDMRQFCAASERPKVGIVWAAGEWNKERSVPLALLEPLFKEEAVEFWNLQGGPAAEHAKGLAMSDATAVCGDGLVALAATIANLDLVITVDTLAAHLAGALGRPAWLMLQRDADWRWMATGDSSPWYPTLRLFRQRQSEAWSGVVDEVREALKAFAR